jgi:hypothetical protein
LGGHAGAGGVLEYGPLSGWRSRRGANSRERHEPGIVGSNGLKGTIGAGPAMIMKT